MYDGPRHPRDHPAWGGAPGGAQIDHPRNSAHQSGPREARSACRSVVVSKSTIRPCVLAHKSQTLPQPRRNVDRTDAPQALQHAFRRLVIQLSDRRGHHSWRSTHSRAACHQRRDVVREQLPDAVHGQLQQPQRLAVAIQQRKPQVHQLPSRRDRRLFHREVDNRLNSGVQYASQITGVTGGPDPERQVVDTPHGETLGIGLTS
ncbi:hypothetical protein FRUB_06843 [Fimbriiglobus ruber]|uniref:Uncharacterized protein n=1 Tax=Fimbriiglobus ruber TaxID=1908690 RepID=A0A225D9S0_9BACT|nr:hypothetical protein FRUB_06843 [Fimbriiglobus ruber]